MDIVFDSISFIMEIPADTPGGLPDSIEFENAVYLTNYNDSSENSIV